jgi:F-type H+-transporting ATPase subunit b
MLQEGIVAESSVNAVEAVGKSSVGKFSERILPRQKQLTDMGIKLTAPLDDTVPTEPIYINHLNEMPTVENTEPMLIEDVELLEALLTARDNDGILNLLAGKYGFSSYVYAYFYGQDAYGKYYEAHANSDTAISMECDISFADVVEAEKACVMIGKGIINGNRLRYVLGTPTPEQAEASALSLEVSRRDRGCLASYMEYYEDMPRELQSPGLWNTYRDIFGTTAPTVMAASTLAILTGKEYIAVEGEMMSFIYWSCLWYSIYRMTRASVRSVYDESRAGQLAFFENERVVMVQKFKEQIKAVEDERAYFAVAPEMHDIKLDKIKIDLEIEHRQNLKEVEDQVKKRLDYQLELQKLQSQIEYNHIKDWVEDAVVKSITPKQEQEALEQCLVDLENLALRK